MDRIEPDRWAAFRADPTEEAFRPLYERTKALVYTVCRRILRDEDDALDAFQGAYARLLALARAPVKSTASIPSTPSTSSIPSTPSTPPFPATDLDALLCRLAIREADSLRRRRARRIRREAAMAEPPDVADVRPTADQAAADRQLRERIETLVAFLPEKYRLPVELHYFHGLSQRDVARALGQSLSTVSRRIAKALRKLEPMMRRAGLGDASILLGGGIAAIGLFEPPVAAAVVFAHAQAAAATLAVTAASGSAIATLGKSIASALALKAKTAVVIGALAVAGAGAVALQLKQPRTVHVSPAAVVSAASRSSLRSGERSQATGWAPERLPTQATGDIPRRNLGQDDGRTQASLGKAGLLASALDGAAKGAPAAAFGSDGSIGSVGSVGPAPTASPPEFTAASQPAAERLDVQVVWAKTGEPSPETTVTLSLARNQTEGRLTQLTDKEGRTRFELDAAQKTVWLRAIHPKSPTSALKVVLPASSPGRSRASARGRNLRPCLDRKRKPPRRGGRSPPPQAGQVHSRRSGWGVRTRGHWRQGGEACRVARFAAVVR
ncbi:MAG: sigma-70 family RNA polymerase sigma factor [Candidatus Sumerlaeota bacterium]|nr:sigma-70 family RNA polymerase sigma factor [Candidatus Sumerlaeota bacterium]